MTGITFGDSIALTPAGLRPCGGMQNGTRSVGFVSSCEKPRIQTDRLPGGRCQDRARDSGIHAALVEVGPPSRSSHGEEIFDDGIGEVERHFGSHLERDVRLQGVFLDSRARY